MKLEFLYKESYGGDHRDNLFASPELAQAHIDSIYADMRYRHKATEVSK